MPTPWDVIRMARETGVRPSEFLEFLTPDEVSGVRKCDPAWLECNGSRYIMALRRDAKRGCYFLDKKTGYCSIYEWRPILCRLFPFRLHETRDGKLKGFSLHDDVECPKNRDGVVDTEPLHTLWRDDCVHQEDYRALVTFFNRQKRRADRKPEEFIALFVAEPPSGHRDA
jgi:Fe-S-cluster containining protein